MNLTLDYSESGGAPSVPGVENRSNREQQLPSFSVEYSNSHSERGRHSDFRQAHVLPFSQLPNQCDINLKLFHTLVRSQSGAGLNLFAFVVGG